jgi:hypothetical protein
MRKLNFGYPRGMLERLSKKEFQGYDFCAEYEVKIGSFTNWNMDFQQTIQ